MIVNPGVLQDLYDDVDEVRKQKAIKLVNAKRVNIKKVIYDDANDFELRSKVRGDSDIYDVYIGVRDGEIESISCDCQDYHNHYASCKHIIATMMEFSQNSQYLKIFAGEAESKSNDFEIYNILEKNKHDEKYKVFKQLINNFYSANYNKETKNINKVLPHTVKLQPKLIYNSYTKMLKLEIKIGDKQYYKIKNFAEFFEKMLNQESYRYGAKLEFVHTKEAFEEESLPLLNFVLKYSEIIKYTNEATNNYAYYGKSLNDGYITISNTGIDELFGTLQGQEISFQRENVEKKILFYNNEPDIKFEIEKISEKEYSIKPNIDIYDYEIIYGKENTYFLMKNILYKCNKEFENTTLKLLQTYRSNFVTEILLNKQDLSQLFSVVYPKVKNNIDISTLDEQEVEKYIPEELFVKLFLDYDKNNYITADIKFGYGDIEFNPLTEPKIEKARDLIKEDEILDMFKDTGFMLDIEKNRLILVDEDAIYNFLSVEIEKYMQKFEVLATENFKQKEIKAPKVGNLGVRVENNLLKIDFSDIDFDLSELKDIMEKYKLKKRFHRLKDGSFVNLEENETMDFFDNLTTGIDVNYKEINKGEINVPIYRTLYLDRLLQSIKNTNIRKNEEYKNLVNKIEEKDINEEIKLPEGLVANLRSYQRIGFEWLKVLDNYKFGGILADDMGLRKNNSINSSYIILCRKY